MKSNKKIIFLLLFIVFFIVACIIFFMNEYMISFFPLLFSIFSLILFFKEFSINKSPESIFNGEVNSILKTYDTILVEIESIPNIENKNLIKTMSFKDMVNVEYEFRKPIYYIHNDVSYDFMLINNDDLYSYTLKINEENNSLLEAYLDKEALKENKSDLDIIDSLDKTTVIRVDNNKEFLVSPVKK